MHVTHHAYNPPSLFSRAEARRLANQNLPFLLAPSPPSPRLFQQSSMHQPSAPRRAGALTALENSTQVRKNMTSGPQSFKCTSNSLRSVPNGPAFTPSYLCCLRSRSPRGGHGGIDLAVEPVVYLQKSRRWIPQSTAAEARYQRPR